MELRDKMMMAIRSRKNLPPTHISLKKLLENDDMGMYLNMCSDRISENEMIDGTDTVINFCDFPDILFTSEGLFDCRHILESYLPVDTLMDAWQMMIEVERRNDEINSPVAAFRKMKLPELLKSYAGLYNVPGGTVETRRMVRQWVAAELWSRSLFSGIGRKVKEALTNLYVRVRFRGLFDMIRNTAENYN